MHGISFSCECLSFRHVFSCIGLLQTESVFLIHMSSSGKCSSCAWLFICPPPRYLHTAADLFCLWCPAVHRSLVFVNSDVKRTPENRISVLETKLANEIWISFFHFRQGNYIEMTKCQIQLIHTLMLSVYKCFPSMVKYGWQRNHILQDLTGLEIYISMKAIKTDFKPVFNNQNLASKKSGINIPICELVFIWNPVCLMWEMLFVCTAIHLFQTL